MVDTASESEDLGKGRCLDAGDSAYSGNSSLENNGNGKTQSDKNNIEYDIKKSAKEENKEAKLESLGFNKSRAAQFARRETSRKREDKRNGEKRQLQKPFVSSDGDYIRRISAQARHIRFSNPLVQPPKNYCYL
ncbi:hypothetical protein R5R35_009807 [Gryllus longicercus]|uniref:Uncharacterized protein n=1 Tax=Gryllus longicercus TaxID=2509291 RepID=A0AAN9V1U7_9ORTH